MCVYTEGQHTRLDHSTLAQPVLKGRSRARPHKALPWKLTWARTSRRCGGGKGGNQNMRISTRWQLPSIAPKTPQFRSQPQNRSGTHKAQALFADGSARWEFCREAL